MEDAVRKQGDSTSRRMRWVPAVPQPVLSIVVLVHLNVIDAKI